MSKQKAFTRTVVATSPGGEVRAGTVSRLTRKELEAIEVEGIILQILTGGQVEWGPILEGEITIGDDGQPTESPQDFGKRVVAEHNHIHAD